MDRLTRKSFRMTNRAISVVSKEVEEEEEEEQKEKQETVLYGTKSSHFETSKIHFPTSEGVSEVNKRANK